MDLTTRCPRCGTVFEASLSDLQLRKGYIRCVQCAHIFDGYAEVVSGAAGSASDAPSPESSEHTRLPVQVPAGRDHTLSDTERGSASSGPDFNVPFRSSPVPLPEDEPFLTPHVFRARRDTVPGPSEPAIGRLTLDEDEAQDIHRAGARPFVIDPRPDYRSQGGSAAPLMAEDEPSWWGGIGRLLGRLILLLLLVLLLAQLLYVYRGQVAQVVPALRPVLERACLSLGCQVPYARNLDQLSITHSALKVETHPTDAQAGSAASADGRTDKTTGPEAQQHFILQLTLRNQADRPQEWPTLVLDLKDGAGTLLVRRNLAPIDYLGADAVRQPFAARSQVLVQVPLSINGLRVNGYEIDPFYP
ncbi:zinc-ribbon and DUF3426 domain-containing protein [Castellaniella sp.]|uniref:zinc-ribbon and DUF3426 domain-containing protein n=1 Tax=Castellaniella sp. TaxID=1955812 RepID=UPI003C729F36